MATRGKGNNKYEKGLDKNQANYLALTPISFLDTTTLAFPHRTAVIHGETRFTYAELSARCRRLASALGGRGIGVGDTVALMAPNVPASLECHYGVPMIGAVINPINFRLDADAVAFILNHGEARVLIVDKEFSGVAKAALEKVEERPLVIDIDDPLGPDGELIGETTYEDFIAGGDPDFQWRRPDDEWEAFSLSYTSGTTGDPKGVVFHHRGIYLNTFGMIIEWHMPAHPVYLWTLPMFHAMGWCFPWAVTVLGGTHVMLRRTEPKAIFAAIAEHRADYMCAAPVVLNMIVNSKAEERTPFDHVAHVMTAGSSPPAPVIIGMEEMGFEVLHTYGLTEVFGPMFVCAWQDEWKDLSKEEQARMKALQGVLYTTFEEAVVANPPDYAPVPSDGATMGEVLIRGNPILKGYLKNPEGTKKVFEGGWFHTGDLGVRHPNGYIELKDRSKDVIISGGENISTIEVENVLYQHPAVLEAAIVAMPHAKWEETPCAFVSLKEGKAATEQAIIDFCRDNLAHFKCPTKVVFGPLPKTATGKIQKFQLREQAKEI